MKVKLNAEPGQWQTGVQDLLQNQGESSGARKYHHHQHHHRCRQQSQQEKLQEEREGVVHTDDVGDNCDEASSSSKWLTDNPDGVRNRRRRGRRRRRGNRKQQNRDEPSGEKTSHAENSGYPSVEISLTSPAPVSPAPVFSPSFAQIAASTPVPTNHPHSDVAIFTQHGCLYYRPSSRKAKAYAQSLSSFIELFFESDEDEEEDDAAAAQF